MQYKPGEISNIFDTDLPPWERGVRQGSNGNYGAMNKQAMGQNLLDFKSVMDKYNAPFVCIFGTALGLIREGDFISHDTDIDVACFNDFVRKDHQKMADIKRELVAKGFTVVDSNKAYLHNDFFIRDGEKIEIWWFDKIDDEWIFGDTVRYDKIFFDLPMIIDFLDTKILVPNNPERFLELTYGSDWGIPNPKKQYLSQNPKEVKKRDES